MYNVYENLRAYDLDTRRFEPRPAPGARVRVRPDRVLLSASPSAGRACVVLLLHMPQGEVSFARPGDERWTWVAPGDHTGLPWRYGFCAAMYNAMDGLLYLLGGASGSRQSGH